MFVRLGMNKMRPTEIKFDSDLGRDRDGKIKLDGNPPKITIGNFIKMMILYDSEIDDETLAYFGTNFSLLYRLIKEVDWETCYLKPNGRTKTNLCLKFDIGANAYESHLREYIRLGLMKRVSVGDYMINPMKIFVGETEDQRKRILEFALTDSIEAKQTKKKDEEQV